MTKMIYNKLLVPALAFLSVLSCQKTVSDLPGSRVSIGVQAEPASETKADVVSSVPSSLYLSITTGTVGSETSVRSCTSMSVTDGTIQTDLAQPGSIEYNYYLSNASTSFSSAKTTMTVSNSTDVVYGFLSGSSSVHPSVTLHHVFGRTGTFTVNAPIGTTLSSSTWTIRSKGAVTGTSGVFNLATGAFESSTASLSQQAVTSSSDLYLLPGTYTVTCEYVLTYSGTNNTFNCEGDVTVEAGKKLHVEVNTTLNEIQFGYSIQGWTSDATALGEIPLENLYPFSVSSTKKVTFAPGNLQAVIGSGPDATGYVYTASSWKFAEHQYDYIGNAAGNTSFAVGTTVDLFGWVGASASYNSYGLCTNTSTNNAYYGTSSSDALKTDWGSIPEVIAAVGEGWFTLSYIEIIHLFRGRPNAASKFGQGSINGIKGLILLPDEWTLPDNCTFTAGNSDWSNAYTLGASGTSNAWCNMEAAGAVFLPAAGGRYGGATVYNAGTYGGYWLSTKYFEDKAYYLTFKSGKIKDGEPYSRYFGWSVRLVKEI